MIYCKFSCRRSWPRTADKSYIGRRAGERVLAEVQLDDGGHESKLNRQSRYPVPAQVQERQLEVWNFWKKKIEIKIMNEQYIWFLIISIT